MALFGNISSALLGSSQIIGDTRKRRERDPEKLRRMIDPIRSGDPRFTGGQKPSPKPPAALPIRRAFAPKVGRKIPTIGLRPRKGQPSPRGAFGSILGGSIRKALGTTQHRSAAEVNARSMMRAFFKSGPFGRR